METGTTFSSLDELGEGPGFRKIRTPLGITAFGVNAIVLPEGYETNFHTHERQEELYFVHEGRILMTLGDGSEHELGPGGLARVAPEVPRKLKAIGGEATYLCVGGKDGYVERDGVMFEPGDA
ncbi:cupin domain-containing protein [Paraconexibacter sp.]|uniref:cupin domain-containing protein n=1 Tax=Paraconexibacter sp. TaxID=2949640 RepID=UPI003566712A